MLGGSEGGVPFVRRGGRNLPGSCDPALASDAWLPARALSRDRRYHRIRLGSRRGRAGTDRQWGGPWFFVAFGLGGRRGERSGGRVGRPGDPLPQAGAQRGNTYPALGPRTGIGPVGQFFRGLAKLGGFLGRKGDGQPGWSP